MSILPWAPERVGVARVVASGPGRPGGDRICCLMLVTCREPIMGWGEVRGGEEKMFCVTTAWHVRRWARA